MKRATERVVLFHGVGQPLEFLELPSPVLGDAEILVRVSCCTLCGSDLHTHAGRRLVPTPTVLGHEIVGRIEAFGPEAPRQDFRGAELAIGTRVSWSVVASCGHCYYCVHQIPQKCVELFKYGHQPFDRAQPFAGGLADVLTLRPGTAICRVPDALSDEIAATANCATATCAAALRAGGDVAGRCVLIFGAGMLGLTAAAMARSAGARAVIVSDPDASRRQKAMSFGATGVSSADAHQLETTIAQATEGRGADLTLELAGALQAVEAGLAHTRIGGVLILAGTVLPTPSVALEPERVVRRLLTIRGVHDYAPHDLAVGLDFLAGPGLAYPFGDLITKRFMLDDVEQAFQAARVHDGGRVAVVPGEVRQVNGDG